MATETIIAPAPPGVQSTFDKPLGPQSSKSEHAGKWKKAFDEITHEDVKPQGQETKIAEPPKEQPAQAEPPKEPPKEAPATAPPSDKKPESPLDAVLSKTSAKEPEKVEEPDVLKEFDEKTANWQRAREVMKNQSTLIRQLNEDVGKLKVAPKATPEEITAVAKERDDLKAALEDRDQRLKAAGAEYSPEYQGLVQEHQKIVGKIDSRMKAFGGDSDALLGALAMPMSKVRTAQMKEAMAGLDPDDKARIHTLIENLETHDEKIADFRKDLPTKYDEITARQEQAFREQQEQALKQLESEFIKITEEDSNVTMRIVPDDVPDGTNWNKEIRDGDAVALRVMKPGGADFKETAMIARKGARYDSLEKRYLELHSDYSDLKSKYNELAGSGPDFKGGTKPASTTPKKPAAKYHETLAAIKSGELGEV